MLRRRVMVIVSAVVLAALLALPVLAQAWLTVFGAGGDTVAGHPQRVQVQWLVTDLPQRPGPIAGLMQVWDDNPSPAWYAISATGTRWRINGMQQQTDQFPALSADGRYLGYLAEGRGYVTRDLVTGETTVFDRIGDNRGTDPKEFHIYSQNPAFWSPDGSRLALAGYRTGDQRTRHLILGRDGTIDELPDQKQYSYLIGWAGNDRLFWLGREGANPSVPPESVTWLVSDVRGKQLSAVTLVPEGPWGEVFGQWTGWLSPGGELLAVAEDQGTDRRVRLFDRTGHEVGHTDTYGQWLEVCPISWRGQDPAIPVQADDPRDSREVRTVHMGSGKAIAAIQSSLKASCVYWADAALSGTRHGLVPADWDIWVVWWWREALLTIVVLGTAITFVRSRNRRPATTPPL